MDLSPEHISIFNEKISASGLGNLSAVVGDAVSLLEFPDASFDVVLCLGPMYHLPRERRLAVFQECIRLARPGAVLAFAYINAIGAYAGWCVNDQSRSQYPNAKANKCYLEEGVAWEPPGVFHLSSPEEMEHDAEMAGCVSSRTGGWISSLPKAPLTP